MSAGRGLRSDLMLRSVHKGVKVPWCLQMGMRLSGFFFKKNYKYYRLPLLLLVTLFRYDSLMCYSFFWMFTPRHCAPSMCIMMLSMTPLLNVWIKSLIEDGKKERLTAHERSSKTPLETVWEKTNISLTQTKLIQAQGEKAQCWIQGGSLAARKPNMVSKQDAV